MGKAAVVPPKTVSYKKAVAQEIGSLKRMFTSLAKSVEQLEDAADTPRAEERRSHLRHQIEELRGKVDHVVGMIGMVGEWVVALEEILERAGVATAVEIQNEIRAARKAREERESEREEAETDPPGA